MLYVIEATQPTNGNIRTINQAFNLTDTSATAKIIEAVAGPDLIECRVDHLTHVQAAESILELCGCEIIDTSEVGDE